MSDLPPGGYNPHPPLSVNEKPLSNYFGSSESSSADNNNPFAFATEGTIDPFQQLTTPSFNPLSGKPPGFANPPPAAIPRNEPLVSSGPVRVDTQHNEQFPEQHGIPIIAHTAPLTVQQHPPMSSMSDSLVPGPPRDSFLSQTGQPPSHQYNNPPFSHQYTGSGYSSLLHDDNASTLPFTGQQVLTTFDQQNYVNDTTNGTNTNNTITHNSDNQPIVPLTTPSNNSEALQFRQTESHTNNMPQLNPPLRENSDFDNFSQIEPPMDQLQELPQVSSVIRPLSDPGVIPVQHSELWTPSTHSHTSENSPYPSIAQDVVGIYDTQKYETGSNPTDNDHTHQLLIPQQEPEQDRVSSFTAHTHSLTGSNGTNTPLPPVTAPPLYHSHSVPKNLHGAAENLTNAHLIVKQNYTNADWQINESSEITTVPSSTSDWDQYSTSNNTLLPGQNTVGFSIGQESDGSEPNSLHNQQDVPQETTTMNEGERAVIGEDSPSPRNKHETVPPLPDPIVKPPLKQISNDITTEKPSQPTNMTVSTVTTVPSDNTRIPTSYNNTGPTVTTLSTTVNMASTNIGVTNTSNNTTTQIMENVNKPQVFLTRPDLHGRPPASLPSILSVPPTVDLTLKTTDSQSNQYPTQFDQPVTQLDHRYHTEIDKRNPSQLDQQHSSQLDQQRPSQLDQPHPSQLDQPPPTQSLQCSSTSAFSLPQSSSLLVNSNIVDPPLPPVVQPHSHLRRNSSVTNADVHGIQQSVSGLVIPQSVTEHISHDNKPITNAYQENKVEQLEGTLTTSSRAPLSGPERSEYDTMHQRDHDYYYNRRGHYDHDRNDDYYYNNRSYYRQDDRPHSRSAYQYETRDYNYQENSYYRNDYRDEKRGGHYNSYYDDRERYWREQRPDHYRDYDRQYHYDRYQQDTRYTGYKDQYYNNYYYPNEPRRDHEQIDQSHHHDDRRREYDGYPPSDRSYSRQNYHDNVAPLPDESTIFGNNESNYINSPGSQYHHGEYDPRESTRIEQPDYGNEYSHDIHYNTDQYPPNNSGQYPNGQYPGERYPIEGYRQEEEEPFRPIQGVRI